jgi:hypothetical protein
MIDQDLSHLFEVSVPAESNKELGTSSEVLDSNRVEDVSNFTLPIFEDDREKKLNNEDSSNEFATSGEQNINVLSETTDLSPSVVKEDLVETFQLYLEGEFSLRDQEKIITLCQRFGIVLDNLEMQLEARKLLLPRLNEYEAIFFVNMLKASGCKMALETNHALQAIDRNQINNIKYIQTRSQALLESIPILLEKNIPFNMQSLDTCIVSTVLPVHVVEDTNSEAFEAALGRLQQELKYKAALLKASALIGFDITFHKISLTAFYRVVALSQAVREKDT